VATVAGAGPQLAVEVEELESELLRVREALQHTVEELEAANEELQAGNEELMAANEELQSTNEELHAVNEELYSVNSEHELKIQELRSTTADLNNLIRATELAILFLDGEARLRMFTPAATEIFPVRAGDIGRDLRDFMPKEADVRLFEDIARALVQPASIDRELVLGDGRCLRRRLAPYRDGRQEAAGLVLTYVDITQQVRLREELARADAQAEVRAIVESVPHLMWAADAAGACDYVNPQFLAYGGVALPEACGQGWLGLVHEEERRDLLAVWRGAVASGQPWRGRFRLRRADGEYRWFDMQAEARTLNEGSERRWYGCITDVHDATVLQEAIVHHESLMQLVADSVPGMVSYWSREGRNEFANTRYAAIVGLAPERMHGLRRDELPGRGVLPAGDGHLSAVLRGEPQRFASELRAADGRLRKVEVELLPHGSDGQVIGYVETLSDVTELSEAQASIEDLVTWSPVPQLIVSSEGRLLRWNDAALSLLCHDAASLAQIDVEQLLPPDLRRRHRLLRTGYFAQPRRRPMSELPSLPLLRGDGSTVEVQIELGPLALQGQSAVLLNLREAPAPRAADAVEAAMEARMSFLASMSHEIRTPLNAILGMSQLLALDAPTERQRDRLRRIEDASTHLMGIVNDILDLSKIESGRLVVDAEPFDLRQLVEQSTALVADKARIKQLELRCHVKPDIPGPLVGDARRIEQVLLNLLGNAVKFTHHGHVALGVGWSPAPDGRVLLRFEVEDTGIGIAAEVLPMLFRPFRQADHGHTRRYGGTGLGLAISRQLARAMNGDCGARSVLGQGSSFWFTVQVGRAPGAADVAPAPPRASTVALHRRWRGRRVLLVEDDLVSQIVAQELIRAVCGLEADVAVDGQDAVDKASATPYDLILMDMQLPVLSGLDATRRILALPGYAKVPIVALTANVMPEDVTRCMEAGMQGHLGKPIVADELRELFAAPLRPGRRTTLR
jgi:PAS domain S-box-containing protein